MTRIPSLASQGPGKWDDDLMGIGDQGDDDEVPKVWSGHWCWGMVADREVQWPVVLPHCLVVPGERAGRAAPAPGHPPGNCLIYSEIFHCPRHVILTTQIGAEQVHEHPVSSFPIPYFILVF